jgi:hypothetical protein
MSDREKLPELIDRFNSGELKGDELNAFLEVMKGSPRIREEVRLDKELNEILADKDILELRQKILSVGKTHKQKKGPDFHYLLLAASLLFLIGLEILLLLTNRNHIHPAQVSEIQKTKPVTREEAGKSAKTLITRGNETSDKKITEKKNDLRLAANFRTNPSYENMIGATRSGGSFRLELPVTGQIYSENSIITFLWNKGSTEMLELIIMDNTGVSVAKIKVSKENKYSFPVGTFRTGLYYFKIMQEDELLYFGKFLVK